MKTEVEGRNLCALWSTSQGFTWRDWKIPRKP